MAVAKRTLDFTNVKDGGGIFNKKRQPEGDYAGKIVDAKEVDKKKEPGQKQWLFVIKVGAGVYPYYCGFGADELWKVRNLFIAAGKVVPKKRVKISPDSIIGSTIGVTLEDDEYRGKEQSSISSTFPASELDLEETEDEEDEDGDEEEASDDEETSDDEDDDLEEIDIEDV